MCSLPESLEKAAKVLCPDQLKDSAGKSLIRKFSVDLTPPEDSPEDFAAFVKYCRQDVRTEKAVHAALPIQELPGIEQRVWEVDSDINRRGVRIDTALARGAVAMTTPLTKAANARIFELTGGEVEKPTQVQRIRAWLEAQGTPLPDLKAETVEAALLPGSGLSEASREVVAIRAEMSRASTAKFAAMLRCVNSEDRVQGAAKYHIAKTGRWGGRIIQPQNFPRPNRDVSDLRQLVRDGDYESLDVIAGDVMGVLRDSIRSAIVASPGRKLLVADEASIEARVLGWVAGDPGYMKAYNRGLDLYRVTASDVYGVLYDEVTSDQRFIGKQCVLGLGYGMGVQTFKDSIAKTGKVVPDHIIEKAHAIYRKKYKTIVNFWYTVEKACALTLRDGQPRGFGHKRCCRVEMVNGYMTLKLPSGRRLWYPKAYLGTQKTSWGEVRPAIRFYTQLTPALWGATHTYGGRLVENIVQAIARDTLAIALIELEDRGFDPVMHIHDEVVCDAEMDRDVADVEAVLSTRPYWAQDLPLGAEGFESQYYKKG